MSDPIFSLSDNLRNPNQELPNMGQRVMVICVKEMIYTGNDHDMGSDWIDDGEGERSIMFWYEIKDHDEKRR